MTLQEFAKTLTPEQMKQAELCATAEELLELARKESLTLTEELAQEAIRLLHPPVGELSDSELDTVAGGKSGSFVDYCGLQNMCAEGRKCLMSGKPPLGEICPYLERGTGVTRAQ